MSKSIVSQMGMECLDGGASASIGKTLFAEDKPEENPDWISQRMAFREALDGMGNLQKCYTVLLTPSQSPNSDIDEVKRLLRMRNASDLSKLLDCNGTGQIKRADLVSMFRKEGLTVSPERLNVLMSALNNFEKGIWSGPKMHEDDKDIKASMQDLEVLAIMRRVRAAEKTSSPSALSGPMGREVDHFRGLCYSQYLKTLEKCQRDGLNVSQVTLQKAFLHPSDISSSSMLKGKGSSRHEKAQTLRKKTRKEKNRWAFRWADPNAFWPGKEDNVRLYLPMVERSTAMALFQRIDCTPAPGVGHWPNRIYVTLKNRKSPVWKTGTKKMSQVLSPLLSTREKGLLSGELRRDCTQGAKMLWQQELYTPFKYSETCPYFHTFPGDECQMGVNFADGDEAKQFYTAMQKQIHETKAFTDSIIRRNTMGAYSSTRGKLENCLRGYGVQKSTSRALRRLNSDAKLPESKSIAASQACDLQQTLSEDSASLAQRKGPLPPIPLHARIKLNRSTSLQRFDPSIPIPSWVPPPPAFQAPNAPPIPHEKDPYSTGLKKTLCCEGNPSIYIISFLLILSIMD
ncbi:hypothetical protein DNTS_020746, partial [Danionella cerebrum]